MRSAVIFKTIHTSISYDTVSDQTSSYMLQGGTEAKIIRVKGDTHSSPTRPALLLAMVKAEGQQPGSSFAAINLRSCNHSRLQTIGRKTKWLVDKGCLSDRLRKVPKRPRMRCGVLSPAGNDIVNTHGPPQSLKPTNVKPTGCKAAGLADQKFNTPKTPEHSCQPDLGRVAPTSSFQAFP